MLSLFNKDVPEIPEVKPVETEPTIHFSVGITDDNRISLTIGDHPNSRTILMNAIGVKSMIRLLQAAMNTLGTDTDSNETAEDTEDGC